MSLATTPYMPAIYRKYYDKAGQRIYLEENDNEEISDGDYTGEFEFRKDTEVLNRLLQRPPQLITYKKKV